MVSIIGDGSMTGGMAYEALNNASRLKSNFIIVLNDNNMSISENVGGMSQYLNGLRTATGLYRAEERCGRYAEKDPEKGRSDHLPYEKDKKRDQAVVCSRDVFEDMGITYLGSVDGHDIHKLTRILNEAEAG